MWPELISRETEVRRIGANEPVQRARSSRPNLFWKKVIKNLFGLTLQRSLLKVGEHI